VTWDVRFFSSLVFAADASAELFLAWLVVTARVSAGVAGAALDVPVLDLLVLDLLASVLLVLATEARRPVLRFRTRFIMAPLT
jgi:hypothetical protein